MGPGSGSGDVTSYSGEPSDLGIDTANGRLFIADDDKNRVFIVSVGSDGVYGTADDTRTNFRTVPFGSDDPEGVAYDPATGHLFISDGLGVEIYRINPVNGVFGDANDIVTHFDLAQYGAGDCEGLGINPALGRLLCVDPSTPDNIYEVGKTGALFRVLSMAALPTSHAVVADVTMAPTSNPTDSPAAMNYWVVDRHLDNGNHPDENDGLLYEMHLGVRAPGDDDHLRPAGRDQRPNAELQLLLIGGEARASSARSTRAPTEPAARRTRPRTSPTARTPSTCVPSMRPATSTPRRPPAAFTVRTAEVKVTGSTLVVTAAPGAKDNLAIRRPSAFDPEGDRLPEWRLHGLRRPRRGRLHASRLQRRRVLCLGDHPDPGHLRRSDRQGDQLRPRSEPAQRRGRE